MLSPSHHLDPRTLASAVWTPDVVSDHRLWLRLGASVEMLFRRFTEPSTEIPRALRRGYQRLCNNPRVLAERLAAKSYDSTIEAMRLCSRVVLAHDSTEIDKVGRAEPDDAGPLRSNAARGYLLHGATAIDALTGSRLGLFETTAWTRSWRFTKDSDHDKRPPHKRESYKWRRGIRSAVRRAAERGLLLTLVHVLDREGDVHENFSFAVREKHLVIVRASADRRVAGVHKMLWATMEAQPTADTDTIEVPVKVSLKARKAAEKEGQAALQRFERALKRAGSRRKVTLELRYCAVTFDPPKKRKRKPVTVNCVWVSEKNAPSWCEPLEWMLLTTCAVNNEADAWRVVEEYKLRWGCEDVHKVLKHGFGLEQDAVDSIESFRRQLAILVPLATHVMQWTYAARESPGEAASKHASVAELQLLSLASKHAKLAETRPPRTLRELVHRLATLGGYEFVEGRPPGWQIVWRGWQRLMAFSDIFDFAKSRIQDVSD